MNSAARASASAEPPLRDDSSRRRDPKVLEHVERRVERAVNACPGSSACGSSTRRPRIAHSGPPRRAAEAADRPSRKCAPSPSQKPRWHRSTRFSRSTRRSCPAGMNLSSSRSIGARAAGWPSGIPSATSSSSVQVEAVQRPAGHSPSAPWRASSSATQPRLRASARRSRSQVSAGSSSRSRITCQRIDGIACEKPVDYRLFARHLGRGR